MDSYKSPERHPSESRISPAAARLYLPSVREWIVSAAIIFVGMLAIAWFDEWRGPIQFVWRLLVPGIIVYFVGRAFWRWWRARAAAIATKGALLTLGVALVGWLDVALANAVVHISSSNYALIIIAPLTMLLGAFVSLAGLCAAGVGAAVTTTALTHPVPRRGLLVAGGVAGFVLNLGHIVALVRVLWSD